MNGYLLLTHRSQFAEKRRHHRGKLDGRVRR